MLETFRLYSSLNIKIPSFSIKIFIKNKQALQLNVKGLVIVRLPLLDAFRTFKGNMLIDNIKLNQLILQY